MAAGEDSLNRLLQKATNPLGQTVDWVAVTEFAERVSESPESVQSALRLLVHRVQSSDEHEALNGLLILDVCAEKCGFSFQEEIGKFRFLNELIKLVSPKYLGSRTSPRVKRKVIEVLFNWTQTLKEQPKIKDAYQMLKWQKVVVEDPVVELPPAPKPKDTIFEDEEKAKLLQKLLHSDNQEDIQAANRLIKSMVKENEKRAETVAQRSTVLETVRNNVGLLRDMMSSHAAGGTSSRDDVDLMRELYETCDRLRPTLFRLASDADDKDESLGEILRANDDLARIIEQYQRIFTNDLPSIRATSDASHPDKQPDLQKANVSLLDLGSPAEDEKPEKSKFSVLDEDWLTMVDDALLGLPEKSEDGAAAAKGAESKKTTTATPARNDLDELGGIFSRVPFSGAADPFGVNHMSLLTPLKSAPIGGGPPDPVDPKAAFVAETKKSAGSKGLEDLDALGHTLLMQALPPNTPMGGNEFYKPVDKVKVPMNLMKKQQAANESGSGLGSGGGSPAREPPSLADLFVPLESIQPGSVPPLSLYEKNDLSVVVHFGKDNPKSFVWVMVVTTINRSALQVTSFFFQAAVPKSMKVKLQPPSATQMPAFNPILPPAAITQVMLLSKSSKEKVKLKYKINYTVSGGKSVSDIGEIENLPLT